MKIQQIRRGAALDMSCDDISLDVITISSWLSADEAKRKLLDNQTQATTASSRELICISCCYASNRWEIQSQENSRKVIQLKNESAAKQLKTYEELSKLDVNC
ncbi:hypothetical protein F511_43617 [Dorcoceras hygrometricum]|uniref:Uncharacterized protein n=1 Tax=Dorcoceras hygrometricum TaxID=472368 RepID=A0A2Z7C9P1_9LAMI|nr:hypothetical protein F511_43617 [Dorcoceras hygrometricum]